MTFFVDSDGKRIKQKCGCSGMMVFGFFMIDKQCKPHEKSTNAAAERIMKERKERRKKK